MSTETIHIEGIDFRPIPDTVPEEFIKLVEFQRESEVLQKKQQEGLAAKDRTSLLGELSLQGERFYYPHLLSLYDRVINFKGDETPGHWRITAVEMATLRVHTADSKTGETTINHYVYSGFDVADMSPPGDLSKPDMSEASGPNTAFRIILTDGSRVMSNYPRIVKDELVSPQLYIEGISSEMTVDQVRSESVKVGFVEEDTSGALVRHEVKFDRGTNGAFVNLKIETNAPQEGWVVSPDEPRESRIAPVAPIMVKQSTDTNGDFAKSAA